MRESAHRVIGSSSHRKIAEIAASADSAVIGNWGRFTAEDAEIAEEIRASGDRKSKKDPLARPCHELIGATGRCTLST